MSFFDRISGWESRLADRLGRYKAHYQRSYQMIIYKPIQWSWLEKLLDWLGIRVLDPILEVTLGECVLTRGKYRSGWRSMINKIKEGRGDGVLLSLKSPCYVEIDVDIYEVVQQWTTDQDFTISIIISGGSERTFFQTGQRLRITRYGCVWHLLHRYFMMLNSFIYTGKFLDMGSSVEVYPQEYEILN